MKASGRRLLALAALMSTIAGAVADDVTVYSEVVPHFAGRSVGETVGAGGLIWRGGITMTSNDKAFGGLSGLTFIGEDGHLAFVSDRGQFVSGQLLRDGNGQVATLAGVRIAPIENSKGNPLPRQFSRDAEAVDLVTRNGRPAALRVGFEHLTRVADFDLDGVVPGGAAREVPIPDWLTGSRHNATLESICVAPPASPVAGSTLMLTEGVLDAQGRHRAWMLGDEDRGDLTYRTDTDLVPTGCAFLPDGDLLVLERGIAFLSFSMRLVRVPAAAVHPGNEMGGTLLLEASGSTIDNMEALAVHVAPDGETRIVIASDDNFNGWQRNLLLEFGLPDEGAASTN